MRGVVRLFLVLLTGFASALSVSADQRLYVPYFLCDEGFESFLLLRNPRVDRAIRVRPEAWIGAGERVPLSDVELSPKGETVIDLPAALAAKGVRRLVRGGLVIVADCCESAAVEAVLSVRAAREGLSFSTRGVHIEQRYGSRYAATVQWDRDQSGFLAFQNTAAALRSARVTFFDGAGAHPMVHPMTVEPGETAFVDLRRELAAAGAAGSPLGIALGHEGSPGDLIVDGQLFRRGSGESQPVHFVDLSHGPHDHVLRGGFFFLGRPLSSFGFSDDAVFDATCSLFNPEDSEVVVTPSVILSDHGGRRVPMPPIRLAPHAVSLLDLKALTAAAVIPADVSDGALELRYAGPTPVAQLVSHDVSRGYRYTITSPLSGHLSFGVTGGWVTGGEAHTFLEVTNAAAVSDTVRLERFAGGRRLEQRLVRVAAGDSLLLDVTEPPAPTARLPQRGSFTLFSGQGLRGALFVQRLLVNASPVPWPEADADAMSDLDGGEDVRASRLEADAVPPPDGDPSETPAMLPLTVNVTVFWSDGHFYEANGETLLGTDTGYITIDPMTYTATAWAGPESWEGHIFAQYFDPCASSLMVSAVIALSIHHSAYVFSSGTFDTCTYVPTCTGLCTTSTYTTLKLSDDPCVEPTSPYVQCADLVMNGSCLFRRVFCGHQSRSGVCD